MANEALKSRILTFVCNFSDEHGYAPSYREIQLAIGVKSVSTVHDYIKRLESEGRLELRSKHPRAVATNRSIKMGDMPTQRIRIEVSDGGILYVDGILNPDRSDGAIFEFSGVLDATQLKSPIASVVACRIEGA